MQDASPSRPVAGSDVVAHAPRADDLPYYSVPDDGLDMGASLGNSVLWVTTLGTGAVQQVFHAGLGELLLNTVCLRYAGQGHRPLDHRRVGQSGQLAVQGCDLRPVVRLV